MPGVTISVLVGFPSPDVHEFDLKPQGCRPPVGQPAKIRLYGSDNAGW